MRLHIWFFKGTAALFAYDYADDLKPAGCCRERAAGPLAALKLYQYVSAERGRSLMPRGLTVEF
jgi:hypothetical protein